MRPVKLNIMKQSTWEAWFIASIISVLAVLLWGTVAQSDVDIHILAISIISTNLAVCLYHGSKPSK